VNLEEAQEALEALVEPPAPAHPAVVDEGGGIEARLAKGFGDGDRLRGQPIVECPDAVMDRVLSGEE